MNNESLSVSTFLVIKKADIAVRRVNILIGPQANGKSILAKLVYFFRKLSNPFLEGIQSQSTKREVDRAILDEFELRFPRYAWEGTTFNINYQIDGIEIVISGKKSKKGKTTLVVTYSKTLQILYSTKKKHYCKRLDELKHTQKIPKRGVHAESQLFLEGILEPMRQGPFGRFFASTMFIPASRSFFANLQKNIFTFMASNLDIDPFLKDFGSLYESSKRWHKEPFMKRRVERMGGDFEKAIEMIVQGAYEYSEEQDWIVSHGRRTNLANASSGQQESLPMLLTLAVWPLLQADQKGAMFFIEEPEAHLFPTSQSHVIAILSSLYDSLNVGFFITSHSPYVLSALNNHILASDIVEKGGITKQEYKKITHGGAPISFSDVSAYTIADGKTTAILDAEYRMIGADMIDEISEHFQVVMNELLGRAGV